MNREELKTILPHREPMLLVDEAQIGEDGAAYGRYTVQGDEYFLQGHFPGNPIVPGVIQCEMIAQTACLLFAEQVKGSQTFYTGINNVKFRGQVAPGDTLEIRVETTRVKEPFYFTKGEARVKGKLCVSGEFSFALMRP